MEREEEEEGLREGDMEFYSHLSNFMQHKVKI
jgi:hypothetical protein